MPEYVVVQCFECDSFQVSQRRKDGKFACKICGSSQSVKKLFARSFNPSQLRPIVQNANLARGNAQQEWENSFQDIPESALDIRNDNESSHSRWEQHTQNMEHDHHDGSNQNDCSGGRTGGDEQFITTSSDRGSKQKRRQVSKKESCLKHNKAATNNSASDRYRSNENGNENGLRNIEPSRWDSSLIAQQIYTEEAPFTLGPCLPGALQGTEQFPQTDSQGSPTKNDRQVESDEAEMSLRKKPESSNARIATTWNEFGTFQSDATETPMEKEWGANWGGASGDDIWG